MNCHICGEELKKEITDLPFKTGPRSIVIIRRLPVLQCTSCQEYLLEDPIMKEVERFLGQAKEGIELEVLSYTG